MANHGDYTRHGGDPRDSTRNPRNPRNPRTGTGTGTGTSELTRWGIFLGVALALSLLVWGGWWLVRHHDDIPVRAGGAGDSGPNVTIGLTGVPDSLDIRTASGAQSDRLSRVLIGNVYETLLDVNDKNEIVGGLASKWETSADGKTLTLTMRSGLTFANGHTLDSTDAVWSIQQAVEGQWPNADTKFKRLASVTNPSPTTVVITLSEPDPTLTRTLAGRLGIVYDAEATIDYAKQTAGSGPFDVTSFKDGVMTLKARDGGGAKTGTITLKYYADDDTLMEQADFGGLDLILPDSAASADKLKDDSSFTTATGASTRKVSLLYNNDADSILSDVQARQAMRLMLDKSALANGRADVAQVLGGPIGPLEPGYEDLTSVLTYDSAKGQSMMGYFYSSYVGTVKLVAPTRYQALAQAIADQYNTQNVKVTVETLDDDQLDQRAQSRDFQLMLTELDGEDGSAIFSTPDSTPHYTNADAQSQYAAAATAANATDYANGLKTYARTVSEDAASDWLYAKRNAVVARKTLSGYPTQLTDTRLPLKNLAKQ